MATVPLAAWMGWLTMNWLYVVGFVLGTVYTIAGSAAQIVLTQVVSRDRLVEAHAKNALASSGAEVAGPGVAGVLIKLLGAPMALAVDAVLVLFSALILRGIKVQEQLAPAGEADFWRDLKAGVQFVRERALLVSLACTVGSWQLCYNAAQVVQILFATRSLGLSAQEVGLSYVALGAGTVLASVFGHPHQCQGRAGPLLGAGCRQLGLRLAAARSDAGQCLGCRGLCLHAIHVRRRCGADLHQLPVPASGGDAGAHAGPHDQHHALVDLDSGRPGCAPGRLAR